MRNFDITGIMGFWYVVEYYASSEEVAEYSCMKCNFSMSAENAHVRPINKIKPSIKSHATPPNKHPINAEK